MRPRIMFSSTMESDQSSSLHSTGSTRRQYRPRKPPRSSSFFHGAMRMLRSRSDTSTISSGLSAAVMAVARPAPATPIGAMGPTPKMNT